MRAAYLVLFGGLATACGKSSGGPPDSGPPRSLVTRPLLATPAQNLVFDAFLTSDASWGHFIAVHPTAKCGTPVRQFMSRSPAGVAGPVVTLSTVSGETACSQILAPFPGMESGAASAQIWVSLSDASGAAVPFPTDIGALDGYVSIEIIANDVTHGSPTQVYVFDTVTVTSIAGRDWGQVSLSVPVSVPQGGWFSIRLAKDGESVYLSAPQLVPTEVASPAKPRGRARTPDDDAAIAAYERAALTSPHPRPLHRAPR